MFGLISGALGVASGLKGLFGGSDKPQKQLNPWQAMESQVLGARDHGEKYGFNPLTLLQYGATSGFSSAGGNGGTPPLASTQMLLDGLKGVDDVLSGDAERRRAADKLALDMAKVQLDAAKSGRMPGDPYASPAYVRPGTEGVGSGHSPLGPRATTRATVAGAKHSQPFSMGENPIAPGRQDDIAKITNSPGVFEIENRATGGKPVTIPGEGEPWGVDELVTGAVFGIPQVVGNIANSVVFDGKRVDEWWRDQQKKREKLRSERKEEAEKAPEVSPSWETGNFPQSPYYR